ncbi:hypothetical protein H4582DRAFT_2004057 [Lactarius indigo]|nr:hypothetical protein H4582DRAFT_2004057 [Lactarius indigo]
MADLFSGIYIVTSTTADSTIKKLTEIVRFPGARCRRKGSRTSSISFSASFSDALRSTYRDKVCHYNVTHIHLLDPTSRSSWPCTTRHPSTLISGTHYWGTRQPARLAAAHPDPQEIRHVTATQVECWPVDGKSSTKLFSSKRTTTHCYCLK